MRVPSSANQILNPPTSWYVQRTNVDKAVNCPVSVGMVPVKSFFTFHLAVNQDSGKWHWQQVGHKAGHGVRVPTMSKLIPHPSKSWYIQRSKLVKAVTRPISVGRVPVKKLQSFHVSGKEVVYSNEMDMMQGLE